MRKHIKRVWEVYIDGMLKEQVERRYRPAQLKDFAKLLFASLVCKARW